MPTHIQANFSLPGSKHKETGHHLPHIFPAIATSSLGGSGPAPAAPDAANRFRAGLSLHQSVTSPKTRRTKQTRNHHADLWRDIGIHSNKVHWLQVWLEDRLLLLRNGMGLDGRKQSRKKVMLQMRNEFKEFPIFWTGIPRLHCWTCTVRAQSLLPHETRYLACDEHVTHTPYVSNRSRVIIYYIYI